MPAPASITETHFALEGFLPLWVVALLGLILIAFATWLARRDTQAVDRPVFIWIFLALRCAAILVLLWMLAGPTLVTSTRSFRTKTVAILLDTSASMGLVDGNDGSGNLSRWTSVQPDAPEDAPLRTLDRAVARIDSAVSQLQRFARQRGQSPDVEETRLNFALAAQGVDEGVALVRDTADKLPSYAAALGRALRGATDDLDPRVELLLGKAAEFKRGKTLASLQPETWLPELLAELSTAAGQLDLLADELARLSDESLTSAVTTPASPNAGSRHDHVQGFLTAAETSWLREIRQQAAVVRYHFGDRIIPMGTSPTANSDADPPPALAAATDLGGALQQLALDNTAQPVEAAILITDGGHNSGRDPRELAPSLATTKLHIVPIGNTKMPRDIILHHTHAPKAVLEKDTVVVDAIVTAYDCAQEQVRVELLQNDTVVDQQTLNITSGVWDQRLQLRWNATELGRHTLALRVLPVDDEQSVANNTAHTEVRVMEDTIRVLVADNFPRWETRYLINLFKRDDRVTFEQLLFEPQPSSGPGARSSFPASLEEWSKYRVVILGDLSPAQLGTPTQELLRQYVADAGGNIIVVAGKQAMPAAFGNQPLDALLPVERGHRALPDNAPFYLHLADEGAFALATQIADDPALTEKVWREMSQRLPIYSLSDYSKAKATSHSLLWASQDKTSWDPADDWTRSFLSWHYVGAGRVVYLAAPVTYQLRYRQGDTFHHRFWGQLLRWTVARELAEGSHNVRLSTDKSQYQPGETVEAALHLRQLDGQPVAGALPQLVASREGQSIQEIALQEDPNRPGTYSGRLVNLPLGPVTLRVAGRQITRLLAEENHPRAVETTIQIDPSDELELRHPLCNLPLLKEIADASDGLIVPPSGLSAAMQQLQLEPKVLESVSKKPLWNRWDLFWIFVVCLSVEWAGRKLLGLQ